jgi:hypothetical protein
VTHKTIPLRVRHPRRVPAGWAFIFRSSGWVSGFAPSFWNWLRGSPEVFGVFEAKLSGKARRTFRPLCSSMRPHRTVLTSRQRYQREALKYFSIKYPEIEISAEGRTLLSMPTPPPSPPPGFQSPPQSRIDVSDSDVLGAIDLARSSQCSPSPRQAPKKQKIGGGRQGTLASYVQSDQNRVRPASVYME